MVVVAIGAANAACTRNVELKPVATAQAVAGAVNAAAGEAAGVRVIVEGTPWRGDPADLGTMITPVRVTIENRAKVAVRVRYSDLVLIVTGGFELRALPPLLFGRPALVAGAAHDPTQLFYLAEPYAPFYPGREVWPESVDLDPYYNEANYLWDAPLPTPEMLARALPEGVVASGGRVSGYVYFQPVPMRMTRATVAFRPSDARTHRSLGTIEIPFLVTRSSAR